MSEPEPTRIGEGLTTGLTPGSLVEAEVGDARVRFRAPASGAVVVSRTGPDSFAVEVPEL